MNKNKLLNKRIARRKQRVRKVIRGSTKRPRLSVFRSNRYISVQIIDDTAQKTIASASSKELKSKSKKIEAAEEVGKLIAKRANEKGIKVAVFDRGPYNYHGRVKALVDQVREAGLKI